MRAIFFDNFTKTEEIFRKAQKKQQQSAELSSGDA